ncbi:hypothetical protein V1514DRAFT_353189 [Lipomyces japonicus]|uniref:uncharacterized protein n=1 Tax=Lipomyces japonicus TaxID=56871 RepID=UPI0034CF416E
MQQARQVANMALRRPIGVRWAVRGPTIGLRTQGLSTTIVFDDKNIQQQSQDYQGEIVAEENNDKADDGGVPWYLREAVKAAPAELTAHREHNLPDLPIDSTEELADVVGFLAKDLGLLELDVIDLRGRNTALGADAIMVVGSARSERHVARAAEELRVYLKKTHRAKVSVEGLVTKERLRVRERRVRKKLSRYTGDVSAYERTLRQRQAFADDQAHWALVIARSRGLYVHVVTADKRWELDLEGLWRHEMVQLADNIAAASEVDLVAARSRSKKTTASTATKTTPTTNEVDGQYILRLPNEDSEEYRTYAQASATASEFRERDDGSEQQALREKFFYAAPRRAPPGTRAYHTARVEYLVSDMDGIDHVDVALEQHDQGETVYETVAQELDQKRKTEQESLQSQEIDMFAYMADAERWLEQLETDTVVPADSDDMAELLIILQAAVKVGDYDIAGRLSRHFPSGQSLTEAGDDAHSLHMQAFTNYLLIQSAYEDVSELVQAGHEFFASFTMAIPSGQLKPVHWRRRLEFLQVAHTANPNAVPMQDLEATAVQQANNGVPVTTSDVLLLLRTAASTRQYGPHGFSQRYAAIARILRAVEQPARFDPAQHEAAMSEILVRAGTVDFEIADHDEDVVVATDAQVAVLPRDTRVLKAIRQACEKNVAVTPGFVAQVLLSAAGAHDWTQFWLVWNSLGVHGIARQPWLNAVAIQAVARSGNAVQVDRVADAVKYSL